MKKRLKIVFLCVLIFVASAVFSYFAVKSEFSFIKNETTLSNLVTSSEKTTQSTAAATLQSTTAKETQPSTLIDINSLTVIDLYPLSLAGGGWDVKHCQGIAIDETNEYIYYSYTTLLVKCDFDGNIIGTVSGISGHLGDIAYNESDKKLYCGYYSAQRKGFYAVIFDTEKITETDMKPTKDLVRTVFIKEAFDDYSSSVTFETENGSITKKHRYGCSGIDGVTFGPSFQNSKSSKELLTVAYGIYSETDRTDNDYQVLLQYDVSNWWDTYSKPYSSTQFHKSGPQNPDGKYFVYTGNTKYGVQTMEYFDELNLWILNCYKGEKESFQNFRLFAIDGDVLPQKTVLKGQSSEDKQYVLSLYQDGKYDTQNDIYGWNSSYGVQGIAYMHDGLFYIVRPYKSWTGTKTAICYLNVWYPKNEDPFELAAGIGNDYSISKKPRITTTAAPKETQDDKNKESKPVAVSNFLNNIFS